MLTGVADIRFAAHIAAALTALAVVLQSGCGERRGTIAQTFPKGSYASPWVLQREVWSGTLEQAAPGLGDEAEEWAEFAPEQVWLAVYEHDTHVGRKLTVRAWAFVSSELARRAFEHFRPEDAGDLEAGDAGFWMRDGIMVRWGRTVYEIFSSGTYDVAGPEQAVYLLAYIEKQTPRGLPDDPR